MFASVKVGTLQLLHHHHLCETWSDLLLLSSGSKLLCHPDWLRMVDTKQPGEPPPSWLALHLSPFRPFPSPLRQGGSSHGAAPLAAAERAGQVHRGVRPGEAPLGGGAQELAAPCRGAAVWRAEEAEGGMSSTAPRSSQWHGP